MQQFPPSIVNKQSINKKERKKYPINLKELGGEGKAKEERSS